MWFCCSLADFCVWFLSSAKHCLSQSALEWKPFSPVAHLHPLLPAAASNFPTTEKAWMHKKGQYFYHCRDKIFFYGTLTLLVTASPKEFYFMKGRSQLAAERRNTFTHVVAPSSLHESLQLLSKFQNENLSITVVLHWKKQDTIRGLDLVRLWRSLWLQVIFRKLEIPI